MKKLENSVSAHFRTSGTTSGGTFVVIDGPLKCRLEPGFGFSLKIYTRIRYPYDFLMR